jgi:hypothetical protein
MLALVLLLGPGLLQYWGEMVKLGLDMFICCVILMADGSIVAGLAGRLGQ